MGLDSWGSANQFSWDKDFLEGQLAGDRKPMVFSEQPGTNPVSSVLASGCDRSWDDEESQVKLTHLVGLTSLGNMLATNQPTSNLSLQANQQGGR